VTDRVSLAVTGPEELIGALQEHERYIKDELLAEAIGYGSGQLDGGRSVNVDGAQ